MSVPLVAIRREQVPTLIATFRLCLLGHSFRTRGEEARVGARFGLTVGEDVAFRNVLGRSGACLTQTCSVQSRGGQLC